RNDQAQPGDRLILGKGLGIGIMSAALKKGKLDQAGYREMVASTTQLNTPGALLAEMPGVHALTDVTGFGLLGHLLEICRGSRLGARLEWDRLPILPGVEALVQAGFAPGAADRNWASYGQAVRLPADFPEWRRKLLCDPQTSGGLLVACAPEAVDEVMALFAREGFSRAAEIGTLSAGEVSVQVA
ncbi:MAG: selenide, water dikinase SelD, partial [Burkholderiales bacterium]